MLPAVCSLLSGTVFKTDGRDLLDPVGKAKASRSHFAAITFASRCEARLCLGAFRLDKNPFDGRRWHPTPSDVAFDEQRTCRDVSVTDPRIYFRRACLATFLSYSGVLMRSVYCTPTQQGEHVHDRALLFWTSID